MSTFNRFGDRSVMRNALDALAVWQPTETDLKLSIPTGAEFAREALHDFFRWAPDCFTDSAFGSLISHSLVLDEMVREVGAQYSFYGGVGSLAGRWERRVLVKGPGLSDYPVRFNPGCREHLRGENDECFIVGGPGPFGVTYILDKNLSVHGLESQLFGGAA